MAGKRTIEICDLSIEASIDTGFSIAMFDDTRGYFVLDDATLVLVQTRNPSFTSVDISKDSQTDILVEIQLKSSLLGIRHLK